MNSSFNDFIEYVKSFYGYGGLYDQGRTREQIAYATCIYLDAIAHYDSDVYSWGDGDSLDRERVRDILTDVMGMTINYNPQRGITEQDLKELAL